MHRAVGADALVDGEAQPARHERLGRLQKRSYMCSPRSPRARPPGRRGSPASSSSADARALALEQRVEADRRAVQEVGRAVRAARSTARGDDPQDALVDRRRLRRRLADRTSPGLLVEEDQVGERAADVDADSRRHERQAPNACGYSRRAPRPRSRSRRATSAWTASAGRSRRRAVPRRRRRCEPRCDCPSARATPVTLAYSSARRRAWCTRAWLRRPLLAAGQRERRHLRALVDDRQLHVAQRR